MHDTAFQIGALAMNIYADLRVDSVLEVGSQAVNGSLRDNALPATHYVGIDIEDGPGVDIVSEPGKPLPVKEGSFDLVIASSVFEHDPMFWMTFLEMCRATRDGGYIYINAPSNGLVHRYPEDHWRFYPDSGKALARWAVSQGMVVTLIESFIAKREKDIWNDFVAVFRKGPITKALPKVSIHEHVACTDVMTWKSTETANPSEKPEDLDLLDQANERIRAAEGQLAQVTGERESVEREFADLKRRLATVEEERERHFSEASDLRSELNLRESELRQRQEEIEQTSLECAKAHTEAERLLAELRAQQELNSSILERLRDRELELARKKADSDLLGAQLAIAERDLAGARDRLASIESRVDQMGSSLSEARAARNGLEQRLSAHFHEMATLSRIVLESQQSAIEEADKVRQIRAFYEAAASQPGWWSILPRAHRSRLQKARLRRLGLFDAGSYLGKNPDVAAAGEDPVHHYLYHGIDEQRPGGLANDGR
jgi:SAM-dependent methyltransferase